MIGRVLSMLGTILAAGLAASLLMPPQTANADDLKKVKVAMSSAAMSPSYPYLYVAAQLGFWKQEGLDVEILLTQGSAQTIQLLAAGQVSVGLLNPEPVIVARVAKDLPIRSIASIGTIFSWSTAVAPDSPIKSIADLKGKKIGVFNLASGGVFYIKARAIEAGLDPDKDLTFIPVGFGAPAAEALRSGAVDAILLWRAAFAALENAGVALRYLPAAPWEANLYSYIVAANDNAIKSDPDVMVRILRGIAKSSEFAAVNPKAAAQVYREEYPDSINAQVDRRKGFENDVRSVKAQLYDMGMELSSVPKPPNRIWGGQSESNWEFLESYLKRTGQIDMTRPPTDFFTDEFTGRANEYDRGAIDELARQYKTEF